MIPGESRDFRPGDVALALVDPLGPGDGRPDSLVYISADRTQALRPLPADSRLRPDLGIDDAGWRAMRYLADVTNDRALQDLVAQAITQIETARRQFAAGSRNAAGEERLHARTAAVEEELRQRFVQVLR